ncbi:MAG: glycoside hydrolase family 88 protein [Bacteroidaceae bacterium]|nr:glycoside hydrolase family 88 protein [Bacteroidaceae bacterium]
MVRTTFHVCALTLWCTLILGLTACQSQNSTPSLDVDAALAQCHRQVDRALAQLSASGAIDTTMMPRNIPAGDSAWSCRPLCSEEWCSGFWPGILWLDYEARLLQDGGAEAAHVRRAALDATKAMHRVVDRPVLDHDLGFLVFCSAGTGMRVLERELSREGLPEEMRREDEEAMALYRTLCRQAADSLATLFRPAVGTILSWPRNVPLFGGHNTIMDNMINLELLMWASHEYPSDPSHNERLRNIALSHATTTLNNHFRPDGTCYHVAVYDTLDGHFLRGATHQGLADSSTWARGQAWAVYGFTMMARLTGDTSYLQQACSAADAFIAHLPEDRVPFWDFDDPRNVTSPATPCGESDTTAPRDASAAAIVASALLELSPLAQRDDYRTTALEMLSSLSADNYQAADQNCAFLLHSTGSLPANSEVDIPIIYADYYYLEALNRLLLQTNASAQ